MTVRTWISRPLSIYERPSGGGELIAERTRPSRVAELTRLRRVPIHHLCSTYGWLCLILALFAPAAFSQPAAGCPPSTQTSKPGSAASPGSAPSPSDPLGRETPRGTVVGFLAAVESRDFDRANQFLSTSKKGDALSELSVQLRYVLNSSHFRLKDLSDQPEGTAQPGLSKGVERIGVVQDSDGSVNLEPSRVQRGQEWIWIFSSDTLRKTPSAYEFLKEASFDRHLPPFLTRPMWLFVPLWKYLALALGFLLASAATFAFLPLLGRLMLRWFPNQSVSQGERLAKCVTTPLGVLVWLVLTQVMVVASELPLLARQRWYAIVTRLGIAVIVWLVLAIVSVSMLAYRWRMDRAGRTEIMAVVRLAQRAVSFLCIAFGVVVILRLAGYDVSTFVAGLGIGGVALAFAAQKTLENLFGGVSVILDKSIRVGDECRIGDSLATVVDIGIRSTRLRTLDRTMMTVPNGQFASMILDNFSMRDMIRFRHVLGVRMETTVDQLEQLLEELRALLAGEPMVDPSSCRVRLIRLDGRSLDIELLCLIKTRILAEFLGVQESLLLRSLRILAAQGASLASPIYLTTEKSSGLGALRVGTASASFVPTAK